MPSDRLITFGDILKATLPIVILSLMIAAGAYKNFKSDIPYVPKHYRISSSFEVTGKGQLNQCFPYAQELQRKLYFEANILSSFIFFNWWDDTGDCGSHVVVHYWDHSGNQWLADNQTDNPIKVENNNPEKLVAQLYPTLRIEAVPTLMDSL
ncbi:MAG: hypothetical protein AAF558_10695 [Verrucomicrobiota bacterium]